MNWRAQHPRGNPEPGRTHLIIGIKVGSGGARYELAGEVPSDEAMKVWIEAHRATMGPKAKARLAEFADAEWAMWMGDLQ